MNVLTYLVLFQNQFKPTLAGIKTGRLKDIASSIKTSKSVTTSLTELAQLKGKSRVRILYKT